MEHDDGENCGVIVPLSLITAIQSAMLDAIDAWHEERNIDELDLRQCLVAMMAAVDATAEQMVSHTTRKETMQ